MKRKPLWLIVLFFINLISINADASSGESGFQFLRTYTGARPSAMAGSFVSISGDIHAMYFNPAGLAGINGNIASATYLNHLLDFQSGFVAYSQPLKKIGQLGVGLNYMNYGEFDQTDEAGQKIGTFNAGSFYLTSSLARKLSDNLMVGASVKFIHFTIESYSSSAVALDLGLIYRVPFIEEMNVGFGVYNLGTVLSAFIDDKDSLPLNFAFGISKKLAHLPFEYCLTVNKYTDDDFQLNVGGEFTLTEGVFLRLGYNSLGRDQKIGGEGDQFAGVSLGLGLNWRQYHFDYSLSSYGAIGYLNRISFSYAF